MRVCQLAVNCKALSFEVFFYDISRAREFVSLNSTRRMGQVQNRKLKKKKIIIMNKCVENKQKHFIAPTILNRTLVIRFIFSRFIQTHTLTRTDAH